MSENKDSSHEWDPAKEPQSLRLFGMVAFVLSIVSFYTTSQGLNHYFFNNELMATLASAAIQTSLFVLGLRFPFYREIETTAKNKPSKAIAFYLLSLVISSTFSAAHFINNIYDKNGTWIINAQVELTETVQKINNDLSSVAQEELRFVQQQIENDLIFLNQELRNTNAGGSANDRFDKFRLRNEYGLSEDNTEDMLYISVGDDVSRLFERQESGEIISQSMIAEIQIKIDEYIADLESNIGTLSDEILVMDNNINNYRRNGEDEYLKRARDDRERLVNEKYRNGKRKEYLDDLRFQLEQLEGLENTGIGEQISIILPEIISNDPDINAIAEAMNRIEKELPLLWKTEGGNSDSYIAQSNRFISLQMQFRYYMLLHDIANMSNFALALDGKDNDSFSHIVGETDRIVREISTSGEENGDIDPQKQEEWRLLWREEIDQLKENLIAIPDYDELGTEDALSENATYFFANRDKLVSELIELERKSLFTLNGIERGWNFLFSKYRVPAWASVILAFSLDLSGLLIGGISYLTRKRLSQRRVSHKNLGQQSQTYEDDTERNSGMTVDPVQ